MPTYTITSDTLNDPPAMLTFDELESGQYGLYHNYDERRGRWIYELSTGWYYKGTIGSEIGERCGVLERLDTVTMEHR